MAVRIGSKYSLVKEHQLDNGKKSKVGSFTCPDCENNNDTVKNIKAVDYADQLFLAAKCKNCSVLVLYADKYGNCFHLAT